MKPNRISSTLLLGRASSKSRSRRGNEADLGPEANSASLPRRLRRFRGFLNAPVLLGLILCGCKTHKPPVLGEPLPDLTPEQRAEFEEGKKVFQRAFEPKDGLGPLFNAN